MKLTPFAIALVLGSLSHTPGTTLAHTTSGTTGTHRIQQTSFAPSIPQQYVHRIHDGHDHPISKNAAALSSSEPYRYLSAPVTTTTTTWTPLDVATTFLKTQFNMSASSFKVKSMYTDRHNGVTHLYLKQVVMGMEVANGDLNLNIDKQGRVVSVGDGFYRAPGSGVMAVFPDEEEPQPAQQRAQMLSKQAPPSFFMQLFGGASGPQQVEDQDEQPQPEPYVPAFPREHADNDEFIGADQAVMAVAKLLHLPIPDPDRISVQQQSSSSSSLQPGGDGDTELNVLGFAFTLKNGVPARQKWMHFWDAASKQARLRRVWDIELEMEDNWYHAHVDAVTGDVVALHDWVSDASYEVYPLGVNDPKDGQRRVVTDPADLTASPLGWHAESKTVKFTTTRGNNVYAQENLDGVDDNDFIRNWRPSGGSALKFEFPLNLKNPPNTYLNASVTNLFYWNNVIHDLFYQYGFDEQSGNFQVNNFGRGGRDDDAVIANAQDGAGYNNANFATPPDGQNGKMRMYVWDQTKPKRDGDLESGIIVHEYAHGISTRLTGGPMNSNCLGYGEAGGMGEGWGDFFATILRMKPSYTRSMNFAMGSYAFGKDGGIRKFVYSTDMKKNPSTYAYTKKFEYYGVHAKGEVWAAMLFEMYWNLVDAYGFSEDWYNVGARDSHHPDTKGPAGNIVAFQLVVDGMKMQPCRPSFVNARDAILQADEVNYASEHFCEIWRAFAKRGLGLQAKKGGKEDFSMPSECKSS